MSTCRSSSSISTSPGVGHDRRDLDAGEARLAAVGGVERGQPHEPVHAALGAEQPVGVLAAGDAEGGGLDAGFLAGARLQQLDCKAAPLRPAHQHAQHHLRPVLGVGPARAGVDGHERVAGVVAPGEQTLLLELRQARLDGGEVLVDLRPQRRVLGGHLGQPVEVLDVGGERRERLQAPRGARVLGRHGRGPLGVLPEPGRPHLRLERRHALAQRSRVKDSPRAASAARGSRPVAAGWTRWGCGHDPTLSAQDPRAFPAPVSGDELYVANATGQRARWAAVTAPLPAARLGSAQFNGRRYALRAVALLELLARPAPARVVAPDLVLVVEDALLDDRGQQFRLDRAAVLGVGPRRLASA